VAYIQRRRIQERTPSGRLRAVISYRVRYRDWSGRLQSETFRRAAAVADVGAGTGKFTAALVKRGFGVCAIDPLRRHARPAEPAAGRGS
jgi:2-polyprenyl-3-methyl-5-hydroxy-6-metoxy-1,4-benzoquinol methylase